MHPRSSPNSSWLLRYWHLSVTLKTDHSHKSWRVKWLAEADISWITHHIEMSFGGMVPNTSTDITAKRFLVAFSIWGVVRMSISSPAQINPFVHCPVHLLDNISGTQTSSDMILDSYESPTRGLSYAVPFVSIFRSHSGCAVCLNIRSVLWNIRIKLENSLTLNSDQP